MTFEAIIYYLILLDAIGANIMSFICPKWYKKNFKKLSKILPANKYLTLGYLVLVLWIGCALSRLEIIF